MILYSANDVAGSGKRSTIMGKDVLKAIEEIDFPQWRPKLEKLLAGPLSSSNIAVTASFPWSVSFPQSIRPISRKGKPIRKPQEVMITRTMRTRRTLWMRTKRMKRKIRMTRTTSK